MKVLSGKLPTAQRGRGARLQEEGELCWEATPVDKEGGQMSLTETWRFL